MTMLTRRELAATGAALTASSLLSSGALFAAKTSAPPIVIDPMTLVDPELRPILQTWLKQSPQVVWSEKKVRDIRQQSASSIPPPLAQPTFFERRVPGAAGGPNVRVVVIGVAANTPPRPAALHIHGGGYHGFDIIVPEARISKRFKAAWNDALHRGLSTNEMS